MAYTTLVIAETDGVMRLLKAPFFTPLEEGDELVVETETGESPAVLRAFATMGTDSEAYQFILQSLGAREPLPRVLKIVYRDVRVLNWEEEENECPF